MTAFWWGKPIECVGGPADGMFLDELSEPSNGLIRWGWHRNIKVYYRYDSEERKYRYVAAVKFRETGPSGECVPDVTDGKADAA